jgi:hypothetical protein
MPSERKFFKTIIQVEVLSEDEPYTETNLDQIERDTDAGDCVGRVRIVRHVELMSKEAAEALTEFGSDPSFFQLDEEADAAEGNQEPPNAMTEELAPQERHEDELEAVQKFHSFLQGEIPDGVTLGFKIRKMNAKQAMAVVWFLQECCRLIPDNYEMCFVCHYIYDSESEGHYDEKTGRCYCDNCRKD